MGLYPQAMKILREVSTRAPSHGPVWQKLAELLRLEGKDREASAADARAAGLAPQWPPAKDERTPGEIEAAEQAVSEHLAKLPTPEEQYRWLRSQLRERVTDVAVMRVLASTDTNRRNLYLARKLFERAVELAPSYEGIRKDYVFVLYEMAQHGRALEEIRRFLTMKPEDVEGRVLYSDILFYVGDMDTAIPILERLVSENPTFAGLRRRYARALRFGGRSEDSIREYRKALELRPGVGDAYVGLAKLAGGALAADDVAAIRECLRSSADDAGNRASLQFALGLALEHMGDFENSFAAYEASATLAKKPDYDLDKDIQELRRRRAVFTTKTVARCAPEAASLGTTPIFIVGMPRAGSTLLEQILGSHSQVEATTELPVLANVVDELSHSRLLVTRQAYPECVADLTPEQLSEMGQRYIRNAAVYRKTNLPYFIDKRPWNWYEIGFIRMILPHAKIVDIRREPIAACFGMYKQNMPDAVFTNDFDHLARYYTEYVGMMDHYDRVLPGHVHRVQYRQLVEDTEGEVRRLLEYCGLPFEENCLRFWETSRSVITPSAEQVRRPIFREGLDQWRNYEPWLGPLKKALEAASASAAATSPQPEDYEVALTSAAMGFHGHAIDLLKEVTTREPRHPGAWKKLAELLRLTCEDKAAEEAEAKAIQCAGESARWQSSLDARSPQQLNAGKLLLERTLGSTTKQRPIQMAELRKHLEVFPTDAAAMHLLSDLELLEGDELTAIALLDRTLELAPSWRAARAELVVRLTNRRDYERSAEQAAILVREDPKNPRWPSYLVHALERSGKLVEAIPLAEEMVRDHPHDPSVWLKYAGLLRNVGKRDESARAYRKCLEIAPDIGDAYGGLADLKGSFLTDADVASMQAHLSDPSLEPTHRMRMHYALAATLERKGDFGASFAAYQSAARLISGSFLGRGEAYNEKHSVDRVRQYKRFFTASVLSRSPRLTDSPAITPLFVVGMPRAGSTLVEQILASHSQVEGTRELPLISDIVHELWLGRRAGNGRPYPDCLEDMSDARLAELGESYLARSRRYRLTDRPYFVDKRPWNWLDAGLIHLILPQARIIDIRRAPMAACFAMYKQQLPSDAAFSYDLRDLGRYYNLYVSLMEHWKSVMPGRIHFVQYEQLVDDTENEIRRMLDYCGLPFEESCLRFWENDRAVLTPSAEQVRKPIYRDAVEQWRNFEPWLGPLKAALAEPPLI